MRVIAQKELRNDISAVLRRAEGGERFTVTVAGRPVAQLGPATPRQWVCEARMRAIWTSPAPRTLERDLEGFGADLGDPFAS